MNIFLIGYRCTGKTSVGAAIADAIGWRFLDADDYLMSSTGKTVAEIVNDGGWDQFRDLEKKSLKRICKSDQQVVATGGGVVLMPENIIQMKNTGVIIWFYAEPLTIYERMHKDHKTLQQRPSLTNQKDEMKEIEDTFLERLPLYEKAMDYKIITENKNIDDVCREVIILLKSHSVIDI